MRSTTLFLVLLALATTGCPKKTKTPPATQTENAGAGSPADAPEIRSGLPDAVDSSVVARVYFSFDSVSVSNESGAKLREIAERMNADATLTIRLEGHADERGTTQYNLALSDRRAEAVARYLVDLGVQRSRMTTTGFGEEKPLATGHDESSWEKNRRVDVLATPSADRVAGSR